MGNKMAPSYANIFMDSLERRYTLRVSPFNRPSGSIILMTSSVCGQVRSFIFI